MSEHADQTGPSSVGRRRFLATTGAAGAALAMEARFGPSAQAATAPTTSGGRRRQQPNIVLIVVDEMRYPREFPRGIASAEHFIRRFMPNLYRLWEPGVVFGSHFTNGTACSPARATFVTGLYPLQQWLLNTRTGTADQPAPSPALGRGFPTYGKLLQGAGYRTPYVGKWHLSPSLRSGTSPQYLSAYGFEGLTQPDILGDNGDGYNYDGKIAQQAADWLEASKPGQQPFCLTVSFVNPHDKQFFWAGTEADRYNQLYADAGLTPQRSWTQIPTEDTPSRYGYSAVPANWEPQPALKNKPSMQTFAREVQELIWGGVTDSPTQTDFTLETYGDGSDPDRKIGKAPYRYWERSLDSYTQMMQMVDAHIGTVLDAVPKNVHDNTVFVMMSDHGEYAGAHGYVSGKIGTAYDEAFSIPLVVFDPRGQLTGDEDEVRTQLTSSVDLAPMLATIAHGDRRWLRGDIGEIYRERLDLLPLVARNSARGRSHLVMASGEHPPASLDYGNFPSHIYAMRTSEYKVVAYARWLSGSARIDRRSLEFEFYDYSTERGRLELDNTFGHDPRARRVLWGWLPALLTGVLQTALLVGLVAVVGVPIHSTGGLAAFCALGAVAFAATNQALVSLFGGIGRLVSLALILIAAAAIGGLIPIQTAPVLLQTLNGILPVPQFVDGAGQLMLGGISKGLIGACVVLIAWTVGALLVSVVATGRRKPELAPGPLPEPARPERPGGLAQPSTT